MTGRQVSGGTVNAVTETAPQAGGEQISVPVKPAATVMLIRAAEHEGVSLEGIQVFMLRRTLGAAFASGMYVFPGGRVEQSDGEDVDHAHRVAAIRECFEEAGVLLALDTDGRHVADGHPALDARQGVYDGSIDLAELCGEHGLELAVGELAFVAHWITPAGEAPRRFDTRFYVAPAPPEQAHTHDDNETIDSLWVDPADALSRQAAGELTMMPPTMANLRFLARFSSVDEAMAESLAMPQPPPILPKLRMDDEGGFTGISLPGDADYEGLA
jgi:8-oxo-dGTP pyrophosphatase MutT (NUDIX family)